jgi:hypothetical protein
VKEVSPAVFKQFKLTIYVSSTIEITHYHENIPTEEGV